MKERIAEKRAALLKTTSKMGLSYDTSLLISQRIAKYKKVNEAAEAEAEKILDIINSSKTEAEILEKLEAMA